MARILSISYDSSLLATRHLLLESMGHTVTSLGDLSAAIGLCEERGGEFNLIVLGHSIPLADKMRMIESCRKGCSCPVLALIRIGEAPVPGAERSVDSFEPEALMQAVKQLLQSDVPK